MHLWPWLNHPSIQPDEDDVPDSLYTERLYTAQEVADYQTSEAELVSAPLKRRIAELETELNEDPRVQVEVIDTGNAEFNAISLIESLLLQLTPAQRRRVLVYTVDRFTQDLPKEH